MKRKKKCDCYEYEERAAIYEYEAGMGRKEAERLARSTVCLGCELNED